jgi:hypothetical protein
VELLKLSSFKSWLVLALHLLITTFTRQQNQAFPLLLKIADVLGFPFEASIWMCIFSLFPLFFDWEKREKKRQDKIYWGQNCLFLFNCNKH